MNYKKYIPHLIVAVILIFATYTLTAHAVSSRFDVYYSLDAKANDKELVKVIDEASSYVYFAIYYFNKSSIADALVRAKKRGLAVRGIMDRDASEQTNKNVLEDLRSAGIAVETQKHQDGIMHIKALVTDKAYASGSYNWTQAATVMNDEILEIGSDPDVRSKYLSIIKKVIGANQ